jgi:serine/threonine protein kinase
MPLDHPHDALPPGYRLEGYEILRVLGQGGFGITYQARRAGSSGDMVAIKELFPKFTATRISHHQVAPQPGADPYEIEASIDMFVREAELICALHHPHIVRGLDAFRANGTAYLVMRYVSGRNLRESLRDAAGFHPTPQSLPTLLSPLLDALETLHDHGLVHGDIKPDNIYLGLGFEPILIDLGAARRHVPGQGEEMAIAYSQYFSAIEQVTERFGPIGPWTDIYQLSAVIYRCITGGKLPDAIDRLDAAEDPYMPLDEIPEASAYPANLTQAVEQGLALLPQNRPRHVGPWRRSMGIATRHRATTPPTPPDDPLITISGPPPFEPRRTPPPPTQSTDPLPWIAGLLFAIILIVMLIMLINE